MSYGKKDEDADLGLVKVDRTQVFQEGSFAHNGCLAPAARTPRHYDMLTAGPKQLDSSTAPRSSRDDAEFS